MTDTTKYFLLTPIKISVISFFLSVVSICIYIGLEIDTWSQEIDNGWLLIFFTIAVSLFLLLISGLVLLNYNKMVRQNIVLSFISFYLPVAFFAVFLLIIGLFRESILVLFLILPFLIPLTYYFIVFRNKLKSEQFEKGFYNIDNE